MAATFVEDFYTKQSPVRVAMKAPRPRVPADEGVSSDSSRVWLSTEVALFRQQFATP